MNYTYHVYHHRPAVAPKYSLPHELEQDEYSRFADSLCRLFVQKDIVATCEPAPSPEKGVLVTLETELPEPDAVEALAATVKQLNQNLRGLCLVIDKPRRTAGEKQAPGITSGSRGRR